MKIRMIIIGNIPNCAKAVRISCVPHSLTAQLCVYIHVCNHVLIDLPVVCECVLCMSVCLSNGKFSHMDTNFHNETEIIHEI